MWFCVEAAAATAAVGHPAVAVAVAALLLLLLSFLPSGCLTIEYFFFSPSRLIACFSRVCEAKRSLWKIDDLTFYSAALKVQVSFFLSPFYGNCVFNHAWRQTIPISTTASTSITCMRGGQPAHTFDTRTHLTFYLFIFACVACTKYYFDCRSSVCLFDIGESLFCDTT